MESGSVKKSSSNSLMYEVPLGYSIEDVRPNGGIEKFRSAAYSNCVRKRLEIVFRQPSFFVDPQGKGLRALPRAQIDEFLDLAQCTIVDNMSNDVMDSYVLSESSLFIYPYKIVIKTCGTTKLLRSIPVILKHAASLSLSPIAVKYSRGCFIFPANQPAPHSSFAEEVFVLDSHFAELFGKFGDAYVIDGGHAARNWHIYWSSVEDITPVPLAMEMCMTGLDREKAAVFYKNNESTVKTMTTNSGIDKILPAEFLINDIEFEPCGYSMNAIWGKALSTIHVTPEDGFSYASFEFVDVIEPEMAMDAAQLEAMIGRVLECFKPSDFSVAIHCDSSNLIAYKKVNGIMGYACDKVVEQELIGGGRLMYQSFSVKTGCFTPKSTIRSLVKMDNGAGVDVYDYHQNVCEVCERKVYEEEMEEAVAGLCCKVLA